MGLVAPDDRQPHRQRARAADRPGRRRASGSPEGDLQPWLEVSGVMIDGDDHGVVDLTDADCGDRGRIGCRARRARGRLRRRTGRDGAAHAARTAPARFRPNTWPLLDPGRPRPRPDDRPRRAAPGAARRAPAHPWSHMLEQVALLVGLTPAVTGSGGPTTRGSRRSPRPGRSPCRSPRGTPAPTPTPPGCERLRLGITAGRTRGRLRGRRCWSSCWRSTCPRPAPARCRLIGRSQLAIEITPDGPLDLSGLQLISPAPPRPLAGWRPGEAPVWRVGITGRHHHDRRARRSAPTTSSCPASQPDLGLGDDALRLLGQLISSALRSWAGEPAYVLTALLGLHRDLPELPDDWPLLGDLFDGRRSAPAAPRRPAHGAARVPAAGAHRHLRRRRRVCHRRVLQLLGRLLPDDPRWPARRRSSSPALRSITGNGRYDDPWVIPIVDEHRRRLHGRDERRRPGLAGSRPGHRRSGSPPSPRSPTPCRDGELLTNFLSAPRPSGPQLATLLGGRNPDALARRLRRPRGLADRAATAWCRWRRSCPTAGPTAPRSARPHGLLPKDPAVISQVVDPTGGGHRAGAAGRTAVRRPHRSSPTDHAPSPAPRRAAGRHFDLRALPDPVRGRPDPGRRQSPRVYTADLLADSAVSEVDQLRRVVAAHPDHHRAVRRAWSATRPPGVVARTLAADASGAGQPRSSRSARRTPAPTCCRSSTTPTADAVRVAVVGRRMPIADTALGGTVDWLNGLLDGTGSEHSAGRSSPAGSPGPPTDIVDSVPALRDRLPAHRRPDRPARRLHDLGARRRRSRRPTSASASGSVSPPRIGDDGTARRRPARDRAHRRRTGRPRPVAPRSRRRRTGAAGHRSLRCQHARPSVPTAGWSAPASSRTARSRPAGAAGRGGRHRHAGASRLRDVARDGLGTDVVAGGLGIQPWLRLVDASVDATPARDAIALGEERLREALDAVLAELRPALANPAAQAVLDLLEAAGAVIATTEGPRASIQGLADLATVPIRTCHRTPRRAAGVAARHRSATPTRRASTSAGLDRRRALDRAPRAPAAADPRRHHAWWSASRPRKTSRSPSPSRSAGASTSTPAPLRRRSTSRSSPGRRVLRRAADGTITVSGAAVARHAARAAALRRRGAAVPAAST